MNRLLSNLQQAGRGLDELSPSCREAARLQSIALDQPLPLRQRIGLRLHLLLCAWCRRYGKQLHFLRTAARTQPAEEKLPERMKLRPEARAQIKRALLSGAESSRTPDGNCDFHGSDSSE